MESLNSGNWIKKTRLRKPYEDRISNLPDSLLQHILAFVSTKDAVRTSILSSRWKNLWKLVPCLDLDAYDFNLQNKDDFLNFMDKFVDAHRNSDLPKFELHNITEHIGSGLKSWVDAAVICRLEHLDISTDVYASDYLKVEVPQSLFLCKTLVVLKLAYIDVDIRGLVSLSSLKIMHLHEVVYADDSAFKMLISSCPVLEKLTIVRDAGPQHKIQVMCICSGTLKWLDIKYVPNDSHQVIRLVIDAPHLEYLRLRDHFIEDVVMNNHGSSVVAELDVVFNTNDNRLVDVDDVLLDANDFSKRNNIRRFLISISNFKSLSFSPSTLNLLSKYLEFESLPLFHGVIRLEITFDKYTWNVPPALLLCCPNLKSFVLGCWMYGCEQLIPISCPAQLLSSLKSVTLQVSIDRDEVDVCIIRHFLDNADALEELYLRLYKDAFEESPFLKKLLTFPRRSPACRIFVH